MSMPHAPPMSGGNQVHHNRKLLEQIQEQKKRLQHGHHSASSSASAITVPPSPMLPGAPAAVGGVNAAEYASISNPQQRAALQHAHANSVGYFITQDSSFGNLILPVLPRITDAKSEMK